MGDFKMELWDLYNENRELTGRDHIRGEEVPQGFYHLVVHIWIRNSKGEYLISQRSADRPTFPLMWECVGGSVLKGEDSLTGALRETQEEVGLALSPEDGKLVYSVVGRVVNGVKFYDILDVWLFEYDGPIPLEQATTKEVAQAAWMTKAEIQALFDDGKLVHTLDYFFTTEGLGMVGYQAVSQPGTLLLFGGIELLIPEAGEGSLQCGFQQPFVPNADAAAGLLGDQLME